MAKLWCSWEADSPRPVAAGCPFATWCRNPNDTPGVLYAVFANIDEDQAKARVREFWPEARWPGERASVFVNEVPDDFAPSTVQPALYVNDLALTPRPTSPPPP